MKCLPVPPEAPRTRKDALAGSVLPIAGIMKSACQRYAARNKVRTCSHCVSGKQVRIECEDQKMVQEQEERS